jgi:acetyltransferase-like isoleucine patch superfamily enzyme
MSGFQSAMYPPEKWNACNDETKALLKKIGAVVPDGFFSTGVPQIAVFDSTQEGELDFTPFKGRLVIGEGSYFDSSEIGIWPHGPVRLTLVRWGTEPEQCGKIVFGKKCTINGCTILSYRSVVIGDNVNLSPEVIIMDSPGHSADKTISDSVDNIKIAPVTIENDVWIALRAMIMPGVTIGHHAVVGAGAIVTKDVPPHCVVAGNPAKIIKDFREEVAARGKN